MQSTDDYRPVTVREQVERLKSDGKDEKDEDKWGQKKNRRSGSPWMLWVILGLVIPIILVGLILVSRNGNAGSGGGNGEMGLDFNTLSGSEEGQPEDWFMENSGEALSRTMEILERVSEEGLTLEKVQPLVRGGGQAELLMTLIREGKWAGFDTSKPTAIRAGYGSSSGIGYISLEGVRKDFRNFRAYFVREGGEILLDVEATEAMSGVPVSELPGETLGGDTLVRCWIAKEPGFDARSDEKVYSWFQILGPDKVDFAWAYCQRGNPVDEELRKELNYGRLIGERADYVRATVKIGNAPNFREDEFILKEIVADEWVLPGAE